MAQPWAGLLLATLLVPSTAKMPRVSARSARTSRAGVVRVQAFECAGTETSRVGTGFAWGGSRQVVTALHVVAGCKRWTVYAEQSQLSFPASIEKVLMRADLALLRMGDNGNIPPIESLATMPTTANLLTAWGYGEGIPTMRSFRMPVADGAKTLGQNVPGDVAATLSRTHSPALDIEVVPIDAPIAPGLSGAPLLDANDRVRAIADGGVAHGLTHVGWAIPARYLDELMKSTEATAVFLTANANLSSIERTRAEVFGAEVTEARGPTVQCGSVSLHRSHTRPFAEASVGTDSPIGLSQLLNTFGGPPPAFNLDVYESDETGATVAIPAGVSLRAQGGSCRARMLDGQIELVVQVTQFGAGQDGNLVSAQFETALAGPQPQSWVLDQAWTYFTPFYRPDGLAVRRKAYFGFYPPNPNNLPTRYVFETLAVRNGTFMGAAAFRNNDLPYGMCGRFMGAACPPPDYVRAWRQASLAVHLSTFSINARNPGQKGWQQGPGGS